MHYGTFPVLTGTPEAFKKMMARVPPTKVLLLPPGDSVDAFTIRKMMKARHGSYIMKDKQ